MNPYEQFVSEFARIVGQAKTYPLGGFAMPSRQKPAPDAPRALIFSPHPDDEVIIGALPLRLLRELKWNVINVAVTQGSSKKRQRERWKELEACCDYIGFEIPDEFVVGYGMDLGERYRNLPDICILPPELQRLPE